MDPTLTERPIKLAQYNRPIIECVVPITSSHRDDLYTITEIPRPKFEISDNTTLFMYSKYISLTNYWSMVELSKEIFNKSKPLEGIELVALKKAIAKRFSDKPTTLR